MGECGEFRCWDELIPDALGLIFRNLSLQENLTVIPRVCKSWGRAISGPYCWREIDIEEWSDWCKPEQLDRMLRMLIARSCGSFRRLSVSNLPDDPIFSFIADHAGSLQTLEIPRSEISDSIVEQVAARLSNITFLDLSYCKKIGPCSLELFGKYCKSLAGLRRKMHPQEVEDEVCQDDEAYAIAHMMPKLRHLEIAYLLVTTRGVLEIISGCRELEFLDLRGCWDVKLDKNFLKEKHTGLQVMGPDIDDWYYCENFSDYSDSSFNTWEFMEDGVGVYEGESDEDGGWDNPALAWDNQALERLEVRFYGSGWLGWPPSP